MKKILLVFFCLLFVSCSFFNNYPDPIGTLPSVDVSKYINDETIYFPKGTSSLDIYSTLSYLGFPKNIKGIYTHTEKAYLNNTLYQDTITKSIDSIKYDNYVEEGNVTSTFITSFIINSGEQLNYFYEWQFFYKNEWKNDILNGEITLYFSITNEISN